VAVCAAVGGGIFTRPIQGQSDTQLSTDEFQKTVLPVLAKNCLGCHSDRLRTGNLSLEPFRDAALAPQKTDVWQKVLDKITAGQMPPRPMAPLSDADGAAVAGWIRKLPGLSDDSADVSTASPGRVTARRLNRVEYNNTIRDLLGVSLRPADEFPIDDSGYGFDNIGDVLSVSPMLMEKYISTARTVARAAVFGEAYPEKPGQLTSLTPKKLQDDSRATGSETPYALRGTLYATYHFPVDAEYEFRWRYGNYRGRGKPVGPGRPFATAAAAPAAPLASADLPDQPDPPALEPARGRGAANPGAGRGATPPAPRRPLTEEDRKARGEKLRTAFPPIVMTFSIDGKPVHNESVEGDGNYNYSHGDTIARVKVTAGDHELRVSWPELANHPNAFRLLNADGRQELFVDYMRILGPYSPSAEPPAGFKKIFVCGGAQGQSGSRSPKGGERGRYIPACVKQIVTNLVTRAYRRPATPDEVARLVNLVEEVRKQDSTEEGVRLAIEAVLVSPHFLFRIERDPASALRTSAGLAQAAPALPVSYEISDFELASRLSYFLWSSMPDDELFRVAGLQHLHDPHVLSAQVTRMLQDPKSSALVQNFGEQWLNLRLMERTKPDSQKFLAVDDELLDAMRKETLLFVAAVMQENRSILDFIDGRFTFVNGPLARYYGITGVNGEQFQRVDLDGEQRSGIVTQGAILQISSYATRTSPVLRGKWVLDNLLGAAPPPPPPDIPALIEKDLGTAASMRQRLEQHRANASCAVCHNQMDPIGFGLENYDAAGAWRDKDGNFAIDTAGTLPDGRSFLGAKGLKDILRTDAPMFTRNFTTKLMTYALGRGLERTDRGVIEHITKEAARDDYRFVPIVTAIVNSRPFRMRARAGAME
jgi:mono/diheme cytochrome c family protein